jgi:tetratricopeptide (TPR) repeat protein
MIPFCFLTLSVFPSVSSAQSKTGARSPLDYTAAVVSVRQLSIPGKARDAYNKGIRRLNVKDWAGSLLEFQHAIKSFPGFYEAYDMLGVAQLAMLNSADAERSFRKSIDLSLGQYAPPHFGLGLILCIDYKQFADAEAIVREGLDLDPVDASGHFALAWVLFSVGRLTEAEQSAREAVRNKPAFAEPYLLLADIHLRQNHSAAAIEDLDAYLKLDPDSPRSARAKAARADAQRALAHETATTVTAQPIP